MNTWGNSWGGAWGDSWGADDAVETAAPPITAGGADPRGRTEFSDDEVIELAVSLIISGVLDG